MKKEIIDQAYSLLRQEQDPASVESGLELLRAETEKHPEDAHTWFEYAGAFDFLGREEEALPLYQKVLDDGIERLSPEDRPRLYVQMGSTLRNLRRLTESARLLRDGIQKFPNVAALPLFLALTEYSQKKPDQSSKLLLKLALDHPADESVKEYKRPLSWYLDHIDDFPKERDAPRLETTRLIIRMAQTSDVTAIVRYFATNRDHFAPTDPPQPRGFYTEDFWRERIQKSNEEFRAEQSLRLFAFKKENEGQVIGTVSFSLMSRGPFQACNLGYGIDQAHEGQGLMTEALKAAIGYVFGEMNLHRIMANHLPENTRSAALLHRLGFVIEGHAKDYLFINERWRDHVLTALTNPNWKRGEKKA